MHSESHKARVPYPKLATSVTRFGKQIAVLDGGGRFRYVGCNNSRGHGDSLLILIHAVLAPYSGPLRHRRRQFDTVSTEGTTDCLTADMVLGVHFSDCPTPHPALY